MGKLTGKLTRRTKSAGISALLLLLASAGVQAQWTLDGKASAFHYVTSKNAAVTEVNTISGLQGGITEQGLATLELDLATVDTAVEIRNERMRDLVFQVADFPKATVSITINTSELETMPAGMPVSGTYTANLSLHGVSQELAAELELVKTSSNTLLVSLARPLIVNAATFGLADGVEQLRTLAGLTTINPNVVIDFRLLYRQ